MGLSPFEAPSTFSMMASTELAHGVWYPKEGMYSVVKALMNIAQQAGVEFIFRASVSRIEIQGKRASGVVLADGRQLEADVIIANADLPYVYDYLLPRDSLARRLDRKWFSCSTVSFFWGVDKTYPELQPHTLFLADDYQDNFARIAALRDLPDNPSLYIHAPARLDPDAAPPGEDTVIAVVPVGHLDGTGKQDWRRHSHFHNLYFVGASTHPGTGVPTALVCARLVADRVEEDWQTLLSAKQLA